MCGRESSAYRFASSVIPAVGNRHRIVPALQNEKMQRTKLADERAIAPEPCLGDIDRRIVAQVVDVAEDRRKSP